MNVLNLPEGYNLKIIDMKGNQVVLNKRLNAGDLVGAEIRLYEIVYFGFSERLIDSVRIPNLHGIDLTIEFPKEAATADL